MGTSSGKSDGRNLEAESTRTRAESTEGYVKLRTVREIRRSSVRNTFIAENVYLVLNSLWDSEPVARLKQSNSVVTFFLFLCMRQAAQF